MQNGRVHLPLGTVHRTKGGDKKDIKWDKDLHVCINNPIYKVKAMDGDVYNKAPLLSLTESCGIRWMLT